MITIGKYVPRITGNIWNEWMELVLRMEEWRDFEHKGDRYTQSLGVLLHRFVYQILEPYSSPFRFEPRVIRGAEHYAPDRTVLSEEEREKAIHLDALTESGNELIERLRKIVAGWKIIDTEDGKSITIPDDKNQLEAIDDVVDELYPVCAKVNKLLYGEAGPTGIFALKAGMPDILPPRPLR